MKRLTIFVLLLLWAAYSYGQGCSDAGFCTMGAMSPSQIYSKKINFKLRAIEVSYYKGSTDLTPTVNAATADFTFGINDRTSLQFKLPYMWVSGSMGNTSGLSDISLSLTRNLQSTERYHINGTFGMKIPTGSSSQDDANTEHTTDNTSQVLPMYYQTSLGSFDLVAGAAYISQKWMFAAGLQMALTRNQNNFQYEDWENYPDPAYIESYDPANELKRGTDIMFRAERAFHFSKVDIRLGLLPIIRISKDEILDTDTGERVKLDGTTGMALTALLNAAYHFNITHSAKFMYGQKITDRDVNPDGLTRTNVLSLAYVIRF